MLAIRPTWVLETGKRVAMASHGSSDRALSDSATRLRSRSILDT